MIESLPIATASLTLRCFTLADAPKVFAMSHERGMRQWIPDQGYADEREAGDVLRHLIGHYESPDVPVRAPLVLGICLRQSNHLIGHVGLSPVPDAVEIGYAIEDAHQRNGFATEAVGAMAIWGIRTFALHGVDAIVASENTASCKCKHP